MTIFNDPAIRQAQVAMARWIAQRMTEKGYETSKVTKAAESGDWAELNLAMMEVFAMPMSNEAKAVEACLDEYGNLTDKEIEDVIQRYSHDFLN